MGETTESARIVQAIGTVSGVQVAPPSVVLSSVPPVPPTQPTFSLANSMSRRPAVVPLTRAVHVAPPSVVL